MAVNGVKLRIPVDDANREFSVKQLAAEACRRYERLHKLGANSLQPLTLLGVPPPHPACPAHCVGSDSSVLDEEDCVVDAVTPDEVLTLTLSHAATAATRVEVLAPSRLVREAEMAQPLDAALIARANEHAAALVRAVPAGPESTTERPRSPARDSWSVGAVVAQAFDAHVGGVTALHSIAYSDTGVVVVSGGRDGGVAVWEASSGERLALLQAQTTPVRAVAVIRREDGADPSVPRLRGLKFPVWIVAGGEELCVWDGVAPEALVRLSPHTHLIAAIVPLPCGLLGSLGWDGCVVVVDPKTWSVRSSTRALTSAGISAAPFGASGLVVGGLGGEVCGSPLELLTLSGRDF